MKQEITITGEDGNPCVIEVDITEAETNPKTENSWSPPAIVGGIDEATVSALASMASAMARLVGPEDAAALNEAAAKLMEGGNDGDA